MTPHCLTIKDVRIRIEAMAALVKESCASRSLKIYGVPRGGLYVATLLAYELNRLPTSGVLGICQPQLVGTPEQADVIVDDIVDTGATRDRHREYDCPFIALIDKTDPDRWVVFPWELATEQAGPTENIRRLLEYIGEDPKREGLLETPERVLRSYQTMFGGYKMNPEEIVKVFTEGACDEMVILKDTEFYSTCEHHMLPFIGTAHLAYIPDGKVIGVSKLARLVEVFSRRLQIQERLTEQITKALDTYLQPKGSACILDASHLCMTCRGISKQHSRMVTSSLTGVFRSKPEVRAEFLQLIKLDK